VEDGAEAAAVAAAPIPFRESQDPVLPEYHDTVREEGACPLRSSKAENRSDQGCSTPRATA